MMSAAREQSCVWWSPSSFPETEKSGFLRVQGEPRAPFVVSCSGKTTRAAPKASNSGAYESWCLERGRRDEEGAPRVRRQQEDESSAKELHDGLAEQALNPDLVHVHPRCRKQFDSHKPPSSPWTTSPQTMCPLQQKHSRKTTTAKSTCSEWLENVISKFGCFVTDAFSSLMPIHLYLPEDMSFVTYRCSVFVRDFVLWCHTGPSVVTAPV